METIIRTDIVTDSELDKTIMKVSKDNPTKYITYYVIPCGSWGEFKTRIFVHNRKPQTGTVGGAEETYRRHGGFFKNGEIVKPSNTFIKQFNRCPFLG